MLAKYIAPSYQRLMQEGKLPEMIYVLLDQSCPGGTHEFADSVNNGPWGKALTQELIPYLESKYRMEGGRNGRVLTGHSSGGWAALWLEVTYPESFAASWPTSPDPSDFRAFTGPNLRARPVGNFYRGPDGKPWMLVREKGKDTMSLDDYAHQERVLGEYGGQFASFEWVFSPRGKDGRPMQMFDRDTGAINAEVADAWVKYDIAEVLRTNADRLRPLLENRIHLIVGTDDTFHLDEPARLLEQTAKELGIKIQFTYLEGKNHMNLYEGGLEQQIGQEMEALVHPKAKAAAQ
jgi:S-formylglutathione hydrolase FrmB